MFGKLRLIALFAFATLLCLPSRAQQPAESPQTVGGTTPDATLTTPSNRDEYRIGPGDSISIQFFGKSQASPETRLSGETRVDGRGMIRMALIDGTIQAACRTENELAYEIARLFREKQLLRDPIIFVSVKDYQSQRVAVIGAVNAAGRFILTRPVSLLELINFHAGGLSPKAGRKVQVLSTGTMLSCDGSTIRNTADKPPTNEATSGVTYDLTSLSSGNREMNPYVQAGDIINVPPAEEVLIVGNVARPAPIILLEPTTLGRAIALAGGVLSNTDKDKIRITRSIPGSTETREIMIDLKNKDKSKGEGFLLQGGDVVEVSTKTGLPAFFNNLYKTIVPTLTGLPMRVIY